LYIYICVYIFVDSSTNTLFSIQISMITRTLHLLLPFLVILFLSGCNDIHDNNGEILINETRVGLIHNETCIEVLIAIEGHKLDITEEYFDSVFLSLNPEISDSALNYCKYVYITSYDKRTKTIVDSILPDVSQSVLNYYNELDKIIFNDTNCNVASILEELSIIQEEVLLSNDISITHKDNISMVLDISVNSFNLWSAYSKAKTSSVTDAVALDILTYCDMINNATEQNNGQPLHNSFKRHFAILAGYSSCCHALGIDFGYTSPIY
jgi:hypothetical protein